MSSDTEMMSREEAEAMALEVLDDYRKQMLDFSKNQMDELCTELIRIARRHCSAAVEAALSEQAELHSAELRRAGANIADHVLWGICLTGLGGLVLGMLIAGFMGLFEFSPC